MDDKIVYLFISFMAFIKVCILLTNVNYKKCLAKQKSLSTIFTLILTNYIHSFINCFCLYGFLFNNKILLILYVIILPITFITWLIFKNDIFQTPCVLNHFTDILCEVDHKNSAENIPFYDIYDYINIKPLNIMSIIKVNIIQSTIAFIGYIIACYKLFYR